MAGCRVSSVMRSPAPSGGIGCSDEQPWVAAAHVDTNDTEWRVGKRLAVVMESRGGSPTWPIGLVELEQVEQLAGVGRSSLPVGLGRRMWIWRETIGGHEAVVVGLVGAVSVTDSLVTRSIAALRELVERCAGSDPIYVVAAGGLVPVEMGGLRLDAGRVEALLERAAVRLPGRDTSGWYQESVTGHACRPPGKGAGHDG